MPHLFWWPSNDSRGCKKVESKRLPKVAAPTVAKKRAVVNRTTRKLFTVISTSGGKTGRTDSVEIDSYLRYLLLKSCRQRIGQAAEVVAALNACLRMLAGFHQLVSRSRPMPETLRSARCLSVARCIPATNGV